MREIGKPEPGRRPYPLHDRLEHQRHVDLLLVRLVDQGKLKWDQPATQVYPAFRLGSAETTRRVLMRHLVCACTGIPCKDFEWLFTGTAGRTPERELGAAYDAAMQEMIFDPLAYSTRPFPSIKRSPPDHASPHGEDVDGKLHVWDGH